MIAITSVLFVLCVIGLFFKVTRWFALSLVVLLLLVYPLGLFGLVVAAGTAIVLALFFL